MKKDLIEFTKNLSELVSAGIPLSRSLETLESAKIFSKNAKNAAKEIGISLSSGNSFSFSLECCSSILFPSWYSAFISISEECGTLDCTLEYISKLLSDWEKQKEKFIGAMVYPILISVLAFGATIVLVNILGSSFYSGENLLAYKTQALKTVFSSGMFFLAVIFLSLIVFWRLMRRDPILVFSKSLSFLAESNVPILQALDSLAPMFSGNGKMSFLLEKIRLGILGGEKISDVFAMCLSEAGFKSAAKIISGNLELCASTGKNSAFSKSVVALENAKEKLISTALALENPILMGFTSVYLVFLLKDTLMPFVSGALEF